MYEIFAARCKIYFDVTYGTFKAAYNIKNIITIYLQKYQIFSAVAQYGPFKAEYYIKNIISKYLQRYQIFSAVAQYGPSKWASWCTT